MVDTHQSQLKKYQTGEDKPENDVSWEDIFTGQVDATIARLHEQHLLDVNGKPYDVVINVSDSNLVGTPTGRDRLLESGLISKQDRQSETISPFELVSNCLFNTQRKYLGRGPYQKKAIAIIKERLEIFFSNQYKTKSPV
jgi:hypothetical protein